MISIKQILLHAIITMKVPIVEYKCDFSVYDNSNLNSKISHLFGGISDKCWQICNAVLYVDIYN